MLNNGKNKKKLILITDFIFIIMFLFNVNRMVRKYVQCVSIQYRTLTFQKNLYSLRD